MFANYETLILAVLMSLLSGTGVFLHGIREQRISASLLNLATEWVIALIAGLTGFYVAKSQGFEESLLYIVVLVSSNNGREITSAVKTKLISVLNGVIGGGKGGANNG